MTTYRIIFFTVVLFLLESCTDSEQASTEGNVIASLQEGGFVLVMRHADAPETPPDETSANPDNPTRERQLSEMGRQTATSMGEALQRLAIPLGAVLSSPTYRTLETARYLGLDTVEPHEMLGSEGMQVTDELKGSWLRERVTRVPTFGNTLMVTHSNHVADAFPDLQPTIEQGETLVFDPNDDSKMPTARILITDWAEF